MAATRNQQPSFDFLTGGDAPAPSQSRIPTAPARAPSLSRRQSLAGGSSAPVRANIDNEALRAQINTLKYELDTERQSRGVETESLQAEIRELERRAEAESRRAEAADKDARAAKGRLDALVREGQERETKGANERAELERKLRTLGEGNRELQEEVEEVKAEIAGRDREAARRYAELERRFESSTEEMDAVRSNAEAKGKTLLKAQEKLAEKERQVGELENEVLTLKAQTGDKDTLDVIKRELAGQVGHIRSLEKQVSEQAGELKKLRRERKAVEVVEEEKHALEAKLGLLDELRRECSEAQLQRRIMEDERRQWTSYLESQSQSEGDLVFKSPEEMARALVQERLERLSLVEQLGKVQPEITVREETISTLEQEKSRLEAELKKAKATSSEGGGDSKAQARLERQVNLGRKEVEYLRAQLKSLEEETTEFEPGKADEKTATRTAELEALVDEYKTELQTLHAQLKQQEAPPAATRAGTKRAAQTDPDASEEATSDLRQRLRKAQISLSEAEKAQAALQADLLASRAQIEGLQSSARTRVLELRSNPTAAHEATKLATLRVLREENAALRSNLQPQPTIAALNDELESLRADLAQRDKKTLRLKTIWTAKAGEFTSAIASVLGWNVTFLPQGKLKLSSTYYPSSKDPETGEDEENFILFDGEQGTMKISGGERSRFAREIREMVEFWVEGRGEVPLFLAACGLEFWEKRQREKEEAGEQR